MTTYTLTEWRKIPEELNAQKHRYDNLKCRLTHYCLLQVLMAALLLVSCAAITKRYPDPLDCHSYYLRINDSFYHLTCPNILVFDQYIEQCTQKVCTPPNITPLGFIDCNKNKEGYYCVTNYSFTYRTHDGLNILDNATCPSCLQCRGQSNTCPCVL